MLWGYGIPAVDVAQEVEWVVYQLACQCLLVPPNCGIVIPESLCVNVRLEVVNE